LLDSLLQENYRRLEQRGEKEIRNNAERRIGGREKGPPEESKWRAPWPK
jgi:hypothetical protein